MFSLVNFDGEVPKICASCLQACQIDLTSEFQALVRYLYETFRVGRIIRCDGKLECWKKDSFGTPELIFGSVIRYSGYYCYAQTWFHRAVSSSPDVGLKS